MIKENSITIKKIIVLVLAIMLLILIFIVGTYLVKPNAVNVPMIYYKDLETYEVCGVEIDIDGFETEMECIEYVLKSLYVNPKNKSDFVSCIPDEIIINQYNYSENGTATIDLSNEYYKLSELDRLYLKSSIVWSLTSIPDIYTINFFVDGVEMTKSNGEKLGFLNRTNVLINSDL